MGRLLEFSKGTIMWMAVASSSCAPTPQDAPEHPGFFSRVQQAVQLAFVDVDPNDTKGPRKSESIEFRVGRVDLGSTGSC